MGRPAQEVAPVRQQGTLGGRAWSSTRTAIDSGTSTASTARRPTGPGFLIRTEAAYRDVWDAYRPGGRARLLFAQGPDGEPLATLFLVRSGNRVVEPYGGMTQTGADTRANYLLKWEAIRSSREAGAAAYDLWGLATGGIAHFKTGFGGREVRYIGAWDLVLDPLGRTVYGAAGTARTWWARRRHGLRAAGPRRDSPARAPSDAGPAWPREATWAERADWDQRTVRTPGRSRVPVDRLGSSSARASAGGRSTSCSTRTTRRSSCCARSP